MIKVDDYYSEQLVEKEIAVFSEALERTKRRIERLELEVRAYQATIDMYERALRSYR